MRCGGGRYPRLSGDEAEILIDGKRAEFVGGMAALTTTLNHTKCRYPFWRKAKMLVCTLPLRLSLVAL